MTANIIRNLLIRFFTKSKPSLCSHFICNNAGAIPRYILYSTNTKPENYEEGKANDQNYKKGKKYVVQTLEKILDMKKFDAISIASKYKKLESASPDILVANFNLCRISGITNETLLEHPDILSWFDLEEKIEQLKYLDMDLNTLAPLLNLSLSALKRFIDDGKNNDDCLERIKVLSALFEKPPKTTCQYLVNRRFLLSVELDKIEKNIKTLTEFGITKGEILKDLWVLKYSNESIRGRLQLARNNHIEKNKTWMVRAIPKILDIYMKRRSDNKQILGDNSIAEYLSERLDCSVDNAKFLITKLPALKTKSLKKMQEIIDFLYAYGFKPHHLCRVPKILLHSVETTRKRLKQLEDLGLQLDSLHILTKSQKQYMQYYESLVKSNKKNSKKRKNKKVE